MQSKNIFIATFVTVNKGIILMVISGLCFAVVNFFVKLLGPGQADELNDVFGVLQEYPAYELVLARSIVSFAISLFIIKLRKLPVFGTNKKWLIIRGIAGTIALSIFFHTMHHLPMALATIVQYLAPIFTIIFAMIFLKEKVNSWQWPFISLAFIGVLLLAVSKPSSGSHEISLYWIGLGVLSAVMSGIAYLSIMKMKHTDAPITIVFYFPMIAIPFMTVLCIIWDFTMPVGIEWLILLIIGIFTQFAQVTLTMALHRGSASQIVPFQYLGAIYAFVLGSFLFMESLSPDLLLGMIFILVGVVANSILRIRAN